MLFYTSAPLMSGSLAPDTSPLAKPTKWEIVKNKTVLEIKIGTYRSAVFDGIFVVDELETSKSRDLNDGWSMAIVYCLWFGTRLKTRGIKLKYQSSGAELIHGYTGHVVTNLST